MRKIPIDCELCKSIFKNNSADLDLDEDEDLIECKDIDDLFAKLEI